MKGHESADEEGAEWEIRGVGAENDGQMPMIFFSEYST